MLCEKSILKKFLNSQKNNFDRVYHFERNLSLMFSCKFCETFQNNYPVEQMRLPLSFEV